VIAGGFAGLINKERTMPDSALRTIPSRRAVFAGAGALLAWAALIATAGSPDPGADAELIRLCDAYFEKYAYYQSVSDAFPDDDFDDNSPVSLAHDAYHKIIDAVTPIRAVTPEGARAKAKMAAQVMRNSRSDADDELDDNFDVMLAVSALEDVAAMKGGRS